MTLNNLYKLLNEKELKIVIIGHKNPDGDAVGSSLALYHYLFLKKHQVHCMMPDALPPSIKWLLGAERILDYSTQKSRCRKYLREADCIFCLDFNSLSRTEGMQDDLRKANAAKFMIDHHPNPAVDEFDFVWSDTEASATAELVFRFIEQAGDKELINKHIAEALFTGVMTDTGSFAHGCKRSSPFEITAFLITKGLDVTRVHDLVYNSKSESQLKLLGHALYNCLTVIPDYRTAYIALDSDDLQRFSYKKGDTEGLVNYALSLENVIFAVMLVQREDLIRLSFRSKGDFAVNDIARKYFEGGGHKNAAGGNSYKSMDETITEFLDILENYAEELRND